MSFMPSGNVQPPKPGQYPKSLDSNPHKSPLPPQSVSPTVSTTITDKIAKEIELLPASTAKTPSQKTKKDEKLSTEKHSQQTGEVEVEDDEEPQIRQRETDISVSNEKQLDEWKERKSKEKRKSKTAEKRKSEKSADQKYPQTTSTPIVRFSNINLSYVINLKMDLA
ncbi:hypothetical protein LOAG_07821 [Loa loa]|uniref:Uncharacterized protein n=1 Tax=Loa loa TaxID=7209 RepID=A0A1S0TVR4_LOALO|nr:hypothetical protein LOAG_07821 [Loa loa]EFO20665.2 hypothetical protein LOAG_07821 [Loa loa]